MVPLVRFPAKLSSEQHQQCVGFQPTKFIHNSTINNHNSYRIHMPNDAETNKIYVFLFF